MARSAVGTARRANDFAAMLLASTALFSFSMVAPTLAQNAETAAAGTRPYNLEAQALASAIDAFARQSGLQVNAEAGVVSNVKTQAVTGEMTSAEALSRMLAGTGVSWRFGGGNIVILTSAPTAGATMQLGAVRVEGTSVFDPGATEGSGSYAAPLADSATGLKLTPRETPQSITIVTREQIEDQNLTSVADVLSQVPGIAVNHADSERFTFTSRGGEALNVMIDGRPSQDYWDKTSNELTMIGTLNTATLDRVEVVRGSTGLMNGVGGFGGSINLVRKRPTSSFKPQASVSYGSWNRYAGMIDLSGGVAGDDAVRARGVIAGEDAGNYIDHYDRFGAVFYGVLEADITPNSVASLGVQYNYANVSGSSFTHIPLFYDDGSFFETSRRFNPAPPFTSSDEKSAIIFADYAYDFSDDWRFEIAANYLTGDLDLIRAGFATWGPNGAVSPVDGTVDTFRSVVDEDAERISLDAKLEGGFNAFGRSHELVFGANYNKSDLADLSALFPTAPVNVFDWPNDLPPYPTLSEPPDSIWRQTHMIKQIGFYGAAHLHLTDQLSFIAGGRYAYYDQTSLSTEINTLYQEGSSVDGERRFVPYAAALFGVMPNITAYLSYTDIFEPQGARDRNNQLLAPLAGRTFEAGVKGEFFGGRLQPGAAVFRRELKNFAVEDPGFFLPPDFIEPAYRAVDGAVAKGWEVNIAGEPLPGWTVQGGFGDAWVKDSDGVTLNADDPGEYFNASTAWDVTGKLKIGGNVTWRPERTVTGDYNGFTLDIDDLILMDAFASYRLRENLEVTVNIENLSDEKYVDSAGSYEGYLWGVGRNVMFTLRYRPG